MCLAVVHKSGARILLEDVRVHFTGSALLTANAASLIREVLSCWRPAVSSSASTFPLDCRRATCGAC